MNFFKKPEVIKEISPNDWMWKHDYDTQAYLKAGWSVGRNLLAACITNEEEPSRILDFGCGHGRIARWIRAIFPTAEIVVSDRVKDGVDFCEKTFEAIPIYSNESYADINFKGKFDLIWLGSVYTHLPMNLWHKLTKMLVSNLNPNGLLAFSFAGPYVADLLIAGERNPNAEITEELFEDFFGGYKNEGFGYARHSNVGEREWGRSIISHSRIIKFLHDQNLEIVSLSERQYSRRQDIVVVKFKRKN